MNIRKDHYHRQFLQTIEEVRLLKKKPSLLLHSCCAPCNIYPMLLLSRDFDLTLYFNNSNIYPEEEYVRRLDELKRYTKRFNLCYHTAIDIIVTNYDNATYNRHLEPFSDAPELSERCWICYRVRMEDAYRFASEHHFDYFTTVMTISRQKSSEKLNEIGGELQRRYPNVHYLFSDLKKDQGSDRAAQMAKEENLYRQQYCGCLYSYREYQKKIARKTAK